MFYIPSISLCFNIQKKFLHHWIIHGQFAFPDIALVNALLSLSLNILSFYKPPTRSECSKFRQVLAANSMLCASIRVFAWWALTYTIAYYLTIIHIHKMIQIKFPHYYFTFFHLLIIFKFSCISPEDFHLWILVLNRLQFYS